MPGSDHPFTKLSADRAQGKHKKLKDSGGRAELYRRLKTKLVEHGGQMAHWAESTGGASDDRKLALLFHLAKTDEGIAQKIEEARREMDDEP